MSALATANNGVLTTGTTGTPVITALSSNGQLIIGSGSGAPAAATLTSGTGVSIVNAANSITVNATTTNNAQVSNLGIAYSSGTFTVQGATASLSSTNPAYITLPSRATPGLQNTFTVTANQTFTDATGTNTLGNSLFGFTTNIAYAQDVPFYIYFAADNTDSNGTFFISRVPHRTVCPTAGNIGQSGNTLASTQGSFFALAAITAANFASQPCICIGAFRMRYTSSAVPWTVQTLTDGSTPSLAVNLQADGIGCFHEGTRFQVATGQFGAATGSFFANNGGTAPAWTTQSYNYTIHKNGFVRFDISGATSSAGSGAVTATLPLPLESIDSGGVPGTFLTSTGVGVVDSSASNTVVVFAGISSVPSFISPFTNANMAAATFGASFTLLITTA
jgi:hypothetical protein